MAGVLCDVVAGKDHRVEMKACGTCGKCHPVLSYAVRMRGSRRGISKHCNACIKKREKERWQRRKVIAADRQALPFEGMRTIEIETPLENARELMRAWAGPADRLPWRVAL